MREQGVPREQDRLCINNCLAVHRWLHFEQLVPDLDALLQHWQLPIPLRDMVNDLPRLKVIRLGDKEKPPIESCLSKESAALIHLLCCWSFSTFGYPQRNLLDYSTVDNSFGD